MNTYVITLQGNTGEWTITQNGGFIAESTSLAAALAYLATVLVFGDNIAYVNEPLTTGH
jgi:hypothetical protein